MNKDLIEKGKRLAAERAVEENVKKNMVIGIGSGSTIVYAVQHIARMNQKSSLNLKCIPSSFQSYILIIENDLDLASLEQFPEIDLDIDGADEIDKNLNLIKGGGGCLVQEKILASNSKELVIVADYRKKSEILGTNWKNGVPIEVIPMAYFPIMKKLMKLGGKPVLRMGKSKSGPLITDNGNFIIDTVFGEIKNPAELDQKILKIPGVVDTGLFINITSKAYIGTESGEVIVLEKK